MAPNGSLKMGTGTPMAGENRRQKETESELGSVFCHSLPFKNQEVYGDHPLDWQWTRPCGGLPFESVIQQYSQFPISHFPPVVRGSLDPHLPSLDRSSPVGAYNSP